MLNHWVGIGHLCDDPQLKYLQSGKPVATLRLAVNNGKRADGSEDTLFVTVICWEKLAENVANYLQKARLVAVVGKWTQRSYETQDGQKRTVYEVVANQVRFLDKGADGNQTGGQQGAAKSNTKSNSDHSDDDVPF